MNKIIYLIVAAIIITGLVITLNAGKEEAGEMIDNNYQEAEMLEENPNPSTKATDYNSSRSNRTTAAAVSPDDTSTGDTSDNAVDNDCSGPDGDMSACAPGDPVPGIGITTEQSGSASKLDSDNDGDTVSAQNSSELRSE